MAINANDYLKLPYGYWWILQMCEVCDSGSCMNKSVLMYIEDNKPTQVCEAYIRRELIKE